MQFYKSVSIFLIGMASASVANAVTANLCLSAFTGETVLHFTFDSNDYVHHMFDLTEPVGKVPLAEVYSAASPGKNPQISRVSAGWQVPEALRGLVPEPHSKKYWLNSAVNSKEFYISVYGNYQGTFSADLIQRLRAIDESFEMDRTSYGEVRGRDGVYGTWRTYQANPRSLRAEAPMELPYVRINRARGAPDLKVTQSLKDSMARGLGVTEIGKFSVSGETAEIRARAAQIIEMNWLRTLDDEEIYVAHVTSRAHVRLYKKYGFEVAEEFEIPGNSNREAILWVRGWQFKEALRVHLGIQRLKYQVPKAVKRELPFEGQQP